MAETRMKCVACGESNLIRGRASDGQRFVPEGTGFKLTAYVTQIVVCLECGFAGNFVSQSDIREIKEKNA